MPRRGRLPKPDSLKRAQRNPGKRRLSKTEDAAPAGTLSPPSYLTVAERKIWNSQVAVLENLKFIRASDIRSFSRFVKLQALFEAVAPAVTAKNLVEVTVSDKVTMERLNKRFLALLHLDKRLLAYDAEFGTTPAGRQSLLARLASRAPQLPLEPAAAAEPKSASETAITPPPAPKESPIGFGRLN